MTAMNFSSLNDDVLFHLIKFVHPIDRFNLLLSGILKGFENVSEGIDLDKRYSEQFNCDVNGHHIVVSPESKILQLNSDHVVIGRAS
jgi:hypothetical protein